MTIKVKRGTRAQLDAAAAANGLIAGQPYLITDENRMAVGLTVSTYQAFAKQGEGTASPAGGNTQIQYNSAGAFAGDPDFNWNSATNTLGLTGADTGMELTAITNEPAAPAAGIGRLYAKGWAGRTVPFWKGPSGVSYALSPHWGENNIRGWRGGATLVATTFANQFGSLPYTGASPTAPVIPALANTNLLTRLRRSTISTGATAGGLAYIRGNLLELLRGSTTLGCGFLVVHRFALSGTLQPGLRAFIGLVDVAVNPTNIDPLTTATPGGIGMAINTNSGNWSLVNNATGAARGVLALSANFPVNNTDLLELALWCAPSDAGISYQVTNLSTGATVGGKISSNIPTATTFLAPSVWITNNTTAAAQTLDFISTYVETDF